jgi:hypothetical protein
MQKEEKEMMNETKKERENKENMEKETQKEKKFFKMSYITQK